MANHRRKRKQAVRREWIFREWCKGAWMVTRDIIHRIRFRKERKLEQERNEE